MRDKAKTVNFGIIYGISAFGLQQRLNIPRAEANQLIDNYFEKYPGVRSYIDQDGCVCKRKWLRENRRPDASGFLRDINSRSRSLANAAERLAMNSPDSGDRGRHAEIGNDQGTRRIRRPGGFRTKMLLTVHDELVFDHVDLRNRGA